MYKVSILITTFNLEQYISLALDSILKQKVNFEYKIIIADDASTDNTAEILQEYKEKYPKKIELILRDKNVGSLKNSIGLYEVCDTEYFAFLDGDDYWLTDNRLQKQVDFLDAHREYNICGGNTLYLYENKNKINKKVIPSKFLDKEYSIEDYYMHKVPFVHTSSILFRNNLFSKKIPEAYYSAQGTYEECALRGEDFRFLLHLSNGKMKIMSENYSVYRIHEKGIWQGKSIIQKNLETAIYYNFCSKYWIEHKSFFEELFQNSYCELMKNMVKVKKIDKRYELKDKEHFQFIALLEEIHKKNKERL